MLAILTRQIGADSISDMLHKLFRKRTNHVGIQFFRYLFVGGGSAVVDIGLVYLLAYPLHVFYLLAVAIAFVVATLTNYMGSRLWIFESTGKVKKELSIFTLVGVGGLVLNEAIVWFLHGRLGLAVITSKLISVAIAMFWSFGLRKLLVFDARPGVSGDGLCQPGCEA